MAQRLQRRSQSKDLTIGSRISSRYRNAVVVPLFISSREGVAIQGQRKKDERVPRKYYKDAVLKNLNKMLSGTTLSHEFQTVRHLHVKPQPLRLSLLHFIYLFIFFFFCEKVLAHSPLLIHQTFLFSKLKTFLALDGDIGPDRRLDLPYTSTLPVYLNERTVTHSRSGFID